jgi:hypothetical protein
VTARNPPNVIRMMSPRRYFCVKVGTSTRLCSAVGGRLAYTVFSMEAPSAYNLTVESGNPCLFQQSRSGLICRQLR